MARAVFFATGWSKDANRHSHSVLAHGEGVESSQLVLDHAVASEKSVNVSVVVDGETAWIFGSGAFRKSSVYLVPEWGVVGATDFELR